MKDCYAAVFMPSNALNQQQRNAVLLGWLCNSYDMQKHEI